MTPPAAFALLLVLAQQPAPADTGAGRPCVIAIDSLPRARQRTAGQATDYFGGGGVRAHCRGTTTTFASDSIQYFTALQRFDMIGNVHIRDTLLVLDANLASYFLRDERLEAHNRVVAVNRSNSSVLRGPNLTYYRAVAGVRDTVEMVATQRPTIEYRGGGGGAGRSAPDTTEPYLIVGDRVRFKGNDRMWGAGRVTVDRSDFAARGDSLMMDQTAGFGVLVGHPLIGGKEPGDTTRRYTLVGTRIELGFQERDVHLVKALGEGKASGADWTLTADTIHLHIDHRKLQQAFAWGGGKKGRPHAVSTLQTFTADSLALDVPDEVLTEARGFGRALSTTKRDSLAPAGEADWITGDTLVARWAQEKDSAGIARSRVHQILAYGTARALTHIYNQDSTAHGPNGSHSPPPPVPSINYSRGRSIAIALKQARIDRVVVGGHADGVHLEPRPPAPAPRDTTKKKPEAGR
jgi:hypothetical protein